MKVLITGHLGYIGSSLVPLLLNQGHEIEGCDVNYFQGSTFGGELVPIPNLEKDIRHVDRDDLEGFDAIIHLAALSNDPMGDLDERLTREINEVAAVKLAHYARDAGVERFLFASTCSIYGCRENEILDEGAPIEPITAYAKAKAKAEEGISRLSNESFSPVFLRAGTAYGLAPRMRFDLVVNNLTAWAVGCGKIRMKSNGLAWRPMIHVRDIAMAYVVLLSEEKRLVHNEPFNIGRTSDNYMVKSLAEIIHSLVPCSSVEFERNPAQDKRSYRVSCDKIHNHVPQFKISTDFDEEIGKLIQALESEALSPERFDGAEFSRLPKLELLIRRGCISPDLYWHSGMSTG